VVVESLAQEFDIVEIAAAAVAMAHAAATGDGEDREIPARQPQGSVSRPPCPGRGAGRERPDGAPVRRRRQKGRHPSRRSRRRHHGRSRRHVTLLGAIEISDNFSLVEVPESLGDDIIAALKATMIRGKKVTVRRER
jgi:ATP-dependent RNA helicase DeaD